MNIRVFIVLLLLIWTSIGAASNKTWLATSALDSPFSFSTDKGCNIALGGVPLIREDGSEDLVCGFEIELFNKLCTEAGLECHWKFRPWHGGEFNANGKFFFRKNTVFYDLINRKSGMNFAYDIAVNLTEASKPRRDHMLFTARYFSSWHNLIGGQDLKGKLAIDGKGFPKDEQLQKRKLKIGTWTGFLLSELERAYGKNPKHIQYTGFEDPIKELEAGRIDLLFAYIGIDDQLEKLGYLVISDKIKQLDVDPLGGVGAATRITSKGRKLQLLVSESLSKIKCTGFFDFVASKWIGKDIWDYETGPLINEAVCKKYIEK